MTKNKIILPNLVKNQKLKIYQMETLINLQQSKLNTIIHEKKLEIDYFEDVIPLTIPLIKAIINNKPKRPKLTESHTTMLYKLSNSLYTVKNHFDIYVEALSLYLIQSIYNIRIDELNTNIYKPVDDLNENSLNIKHLKTLIKPGKSTIIHRFNNERLEYNFKITDVLSLEEIAVILLKHPKLYALLHVNLPFKEFCDLRTNLHTLLNHDFSYIFNQHFEHTNYLTTLLTETVNIEYNVKTPLTIFNSLVDTLFNDSIVKHENLHTTNERCKKEDPNRQSQTKYYMLIFNVYYNAHDVQKVIEYNDDLKSVRNMITDNKENFVYRFVDANKKEPLASIYETGVPTTKPIETFTNIKALHTYLTKLHTNSKFIIYVSLNNTFSPNNPSKYVQLKDINERFIFTYKATLDLTSHNTLLTTHHVPAFNLILTYIAQELYKHIDFTNKVGGISGKTISTNNKKMDDIYKYFVGLANNLAHQYSTSSSFINAFVKEIMSLSDNIIHPKDAAIFIMTFTKHLESSQRLDIIEINQFIKRYFVSA